jgi:uncharacterized membrane protein YczE
MRVSGNYVRRLTQLFTGLALYGISMAFMVKSDLGLNPWDVFHQGLSKVTGLSFGLVVILLGIPILALWIPLRQRPGFGTIANLVVIGFVVDAALALLPAGGNLPARVCYLVGGILINGLATGLYIGARMGPGPRDRCGGGSCCSSAAWRPTGWRRPATSGPGSVRARATG